MYEIKNIIAIALYQFRQQLFFRNTTTFDTIAMKSFSMNLILAACALHEAGAFSGRPQMPPPSRQSSSSSHGGMVVDDISRRSEAVTLRAATVGSSNPRSSKSDTPKPHPRTPTLNEQAELEIIRKELIQKYISLGHSEEYATKEVNYFLEDSERSAQYVEMRRVAMARGNDLGIEMFVQFAAAFLVGWGFSWMMDAFHAHMAANPDGGLPWMP